MTSRWPDWMRKETLADYLDLKPGAIDQYVKRGLFPRPHQVGEALLWSRQEVDNAIRGSDDHADSSADGNPYIKRVADAQKILADVRPPAARALRQS